MCVAVVFTRNSQLCPDNAGTHPPASIMASSELEDQEEQFTCPITRLPVPDFTVAITAVGQAYDPVAINDWFARGYCTDPATGAELYALDTRVFCYHGDMHLLKSELQRVRTSYLQHPDLPPDYFVFGREPEQFIPNGTTNCYMPPTPQLQLK